MKQDIPLRATQISVSSKQDDEFVAAATDPVRRSASIAAITKQRTKLLWVVGIVMLGFFGLCFLDSSQPNGLLVLILILPLMQLHKCEADLKLLRVIERLQNEEKSAV